MARYDFAPTRRRRSPAKLILIVILLLLLGLLAYAVVKDKEVPVRKIEQDVTNEVLAN